MKLFLLLFFFFFGITVVQSQTLKKYPIGKSGCSLYSYCESKYEMTLSDDSSEVYTGECTIAGVSYGSICVKLLNPLEDLTMAEDLLISYSDYLKTSFDITKAVGYGKGHILNNNEKTRGILDYWEDKEMTKWKIKAWTDGKYIGFLYASSKNELPESKVNVFLDSFRLPGM